MNEQGRKSKQTDKISVKQSPSSIFLINITKSKIIHFSKHQKQAKRTIFLLFFVLVFCDVFCSSVFTKIRKRRSVRQNPIFRPSNATVAPFHPPHHQEYFAKKGKTKKINSKSVATQTAWVLNQPKPTNLHLQRTEWESFH